MTESRGYAYPRKIIWRKDGKWMQRFDVEVTERAFSFASSRF